MRAKGEFFGLLGFEENLKLLGGWIKGAKEGFESVEAWGAFGLCWGGKVGDFFIFGGILGLGWLWDEIVDLDLRLWL